jgi:MFS family permease
MRRIVNALCFALAFAIPAWVGAVAYPFQASPYLDAKLTFQQFCFYAFVAGAFGGAIYSATLAYRNRNSSIARSLLSGIVTLIGTFLGAFLLALLSGTESPWLRGSVLIASLTGFAVVCALLLNDSGLTRRSTRTATGGPSAPPERPVN